MNGKEKNWVPPHFYRRNNDGGWNNFADVEEFVEETGTWKPATSLSGGRSKYGGVAVNLDLICG